MKLNEATKVNTINNEYITLLDASGNPLLINKSDLSKTIKSLMFPSWQVTLAPGEEYDLKVSHYGLYGKVWRFRFNWFIRHWCTTWSCNDWLL